MNYCTLVTHFHFSQLVSLSHCGQTFAQLYFSTCIQSDLYLPIDVCRYFIEFCFNTLLSSQLLYCYSPTPPPNLGFNILHCVCFYLYIDSFLYLLCFTVYLIVLSVFVTAIHHSSF